MTAAERVADLYRRHAGPWAAARGAKLEDGVFGEQVEEVTGPGQAV